ncbi:hypothetical protein SARC_05183 [Sphaeroforma arctica JP610]|uniref:Putative 5'-nucleotidase C-terminal domain-containing protein n=1 Tax=Sphaeroforma arctica JP610 TaxID=667725 RepID=A0A0L0G0D8_9EUKA|nr:hypothetical protein SARC_05183 [Sphaeroforma arctica JP610]KNC82535.1 hypothetical protein SARC_05183 [Sphaeroforma arctica JP610]|eukprot:XP_014156437.1 hypothetical protein SARC_05183 [Sphaeroforma arctica JP610]
MHYLVSLTIIFGLCSIKSPVASTVRLHHPTDDTTNNGVVFDVNILQTTDIHGWITGHRHQPTYNCDIGDVYSFTTHMRELANNRNSSFMMFDSGDLIEGTGISDATEMHGLYIFKTLTHLNYDGLAVGNHDVGHKDVTKYIHETFAPHWGSNYITSNVLWAENGKPLGGSQYQVQTTLPGMRVLKLGFLYKFLEHTSNVVVVPPVKSVKEEYFRKAMAEAVDLIVVIMHIAPDMEDMNYIHTAIRRAQPDVAIAFLAGHSHVMRFHAVDQNAFVIQSDHYLYHLGVAKFLLVDGKITHLYHKQIRCNRTALASYVGEPTNEFQLPGGYALKKDLARWTEELSLDTVVGQMQHTYSKSLQVYNKWSLRNLFVEHVIPKTLFAETPLKHKPFYISGAFFLRDNLYQGNVTEADIYAVIPFTDKFHQYEEVQGTVLIALVRKLLSKASQNWGGPAWFVTQEWIEPDTTYTVVGTVYDFFKLDAQVKTIPGWTEVSSNITTIYGPRSALHTYIQRSSVRSAVGA